ncbi:MAG: hypothetical protein JO093_19135 [Acidobacteria bacterium]|nr:hypothetical protein [Acidobacteriota bacterium]MBV9071424.1 hypothetical protein [Acidobacteriota bacterium]MBV9187739.1 hypothetical protein [Acidobacteriota bacterium]
MRSAAAAIGWEFRRRHRWGLLALACYPIAMAILRMFLYASGRRVHIDDEQSFALVVAVPLTATFLYLVSVFSFGLAGDLSARRSMYPARMFTLPVTNNALAAWPMIYGAAAMIMLWAVTRLLALWPSGIDVPVIWPALLAASLLAWTQALTWMPYALPGLRVVITVVWLAAIDAVIMVALNVKAGELVMLAILAPHVPLAYVTARYAIARARRGDDPDWRPLFVRLGRLALPRRREHFRSPARAQMWLEWRQHGRSLPALVAIVLPFELALLFLFRDTPALVFEMLIVVLTTPPLMALFAAATVSDSTMTRFIATRPVTSASLIAAKLKVTIWSMLAAWLLVLVAVPPALKFSGTLPLVIDRMHRLAEVVGVPRAAVAMLLVFIALLATTWKQLVQSLYIGMSGREWLIKGSVFVTLALLGMVVPAAHWVITNKRLIAMLWNAGGWIFAILVCLKLAAAAEIAIRLYDRQLLTDRALVFAALFWAGTVFAFYGVLAWTFPEVLIRRYVLILVAIVAVPLARLSAAPLALAWNRHR